MLPELYTVGYSDDVLRSLDVVAEPLTGTSFQFFSKVAKDQQAHICYGFPRRLSNGKGTTICQAVIGPSGDLITYYDKLHLCHIGECSEKSSFVGGDGAVTFEIDGVKLGLMICYDVRFPLLARRLAQAGVHVLLHPSAFPKDNTYASWHPFVMTRALENQVYMMSLSRAGSHFGGSLACPPWLDSPGGTLQPRKLGDEEGMLPLTVDLDVIEATQRDYSFGPDEHGGLEDGSLHIRSRL